MRTCTAASAAARLVLRRCRPSVAHRARALLRATISASMASSSGTGAPAGGDVPLQPQPPQQLAPRSTRDDGFRIVSERVAYKRYVTVFDRLVEFPPATTAGSAAAAEAPPAARFAFDVVGHPRAQFHFVTVFPFHSAAANGGGEPTVTMIREYAQGPNHFVWSLPAGGVDPARHASLAATAAAELSEECRLLADGAALIRLLPENHAGLLETKWAANRYTPFLALDALPDPAPGARDAEEALMTVHRVPLSRLEELIYGEDVLVPTAVTTQLALRELRARRLIP